MARLSGDGNQEQLALTAWAPAVDVAETEKEYRITAELPNVKKDDVHVTLDNGLLTIQGDRKEDKEERGLRFHRRELSYGHFMRRFTMPEDADDSKVEASFKDGMLNIVVARTPSKKPSKKEIAVH